MSVVRSLGLFSDMTAVKRPTFLQPRLHLRRPLAMQLRFKGRERLPRSWLHFVCSPSLALKILPGPQKKARPFSKAKREKPAVQGLVCVQKMHFVSMMCVDSQTVQCTHPQCLRGKAKAAKKELQQQGQPPSFLLM